MSDALKAQRRPSMKRISTMAIERMQTFKGKQLTIGLDLEDRTSLGHWSAHEYSHSNTDH